jgi:hypothetical protein
VVSTRFDISIDDLGWCYDGCMACFRTRALWLWMLCLAGFVGWWICGEGGGDVMDSVVQMWSWRAGAVSPESGSDDARTLSW